MIQKWWLPFTRRYPTIDPCVPFVKVSEIFALFGSLIYPFVQVEINNINPHYVGYTDTHVHKLTRRFYAEPDSQETHRSIRYIENFPVLCVLLRSSILWRFEINLLNYLFMRSTTIWCCCWGEKTSMMRAKNVVRTARLRALACARACVYVFFLFGFLFVW